MKKGLAILPSWYGIIRMAEKTGTVPWKIETSLPAIYWYIRAQFIWNTQAKLDKEAYDRAKRSRKRGK